MHFSLAEVKICLIYLHFQPKVIFLHRCPAFSPIFAPSSSIDICLYFQSVSYSPLLRISILIRNSSANFSFFHHSHSVFPSSTGQNAIYYTLYLSKTEIGKQYLPNQKFTLKLYQGLCSSYSKHGCRAIS